jgi:hypothetical protein
MFVMLDYRAHKLYILIFGIPLFILRWFIMLGTPLAAFAIAKSYATSWVGVLLLSIVAYLIISICTQILVLLLSKFIEFAFALFVDIIPADGRTKEEAKLVTWGGEKAIALLALGRTSPKDWTDELFEDVTKGFFVWFYKDAIFKRLSFIRTHQQDNPDYVSNEWSNVRLLKENNLALPMVENIVCNPIYRGWVISGIFFLYLILFQPGM